MVGLRRSLSALVKLVMVTVADRRSRVGFADVWRAAPSRGSLRSEAATAGVVAAAPPALSKAPAVAGDSPARGALLVAPGLGFAKPKRVHFQ